MMVEDFLYENNSTLSLDDFMEIRNPVKGIKIASFFICIVSGLCSVVALLYFTFRK